jgi:hypothetical protein
VKTKLYLKWIGRASAWLLLVAIIVAAISGWGLVHTETIYKASFHHIDRGAADHIHRDVQFPLEIAVIVHVLANSRLSLSSRCAKKTWLLNGLFICLGIALLIGVIYMEHFA